MGGGGETEPLVVDEKQQTYDVVETLAIQVEANDDDDNATWQERFHDWLYPPGVPRECQLMRMENLAVPCCYLLVGIMQGLSSPLINLYPLELKATEAQQVTISNIRALPASLKLIFGFISDNLPLGGYRRKSYMFIGWIITSLFMWSLLFFSNLTLDRQQVQEVDDEGMLVTKEVVIAPHDAPSILFFSLSVLGFGTGFWLADVMGDSIVAEKAKLEVDKGQIQSTCYACRFFGVMCGAPLSTFLYSHVGPQSVIELLAILPLCILPLVYLFQEQKLQKQTNGAVGQDKLQEQDQQQYTTIKSTREQCQEIFKTVCSRSVWQPMAFVYLYNLLQVGNGAWRQFLKTVLHFTAQQLNIILIAASVLLYLGILAYKYWFITWSWRWVYVMTTSLNGFFSMLQILLIQGITFGLSPFWFALGDDAFADFIGGIQFLPTTIMMVHLCPAGSEGASYAMFTTVNNSALIMNSAISTLLLGIWDVSEETLEAGDYSGMIRLTLLTTGLQASGILLVCMLPHGKDDLVRLSHGNRGTSTIGGIIFLAITFLSILYSVVVGVLNIINPSWAGAS